MTAGATIQTAKSFESTKSDSAEASARHILRLIVGHFHGAPGRVLRDASLLRVFSCDGWAVERYVPGRLYALECGWLSAAAETLILTAAGYTAAFVEPPAQERPRPA